MDRVFAPSCDKSVSRTACAVFMVLAFACEPTDALAQNGTVNFSGHVGRSEPLTIVVFADRALLPLPESAGNIALTNDAGETIAFHRVRYGGDYVSIELPRARRQEFRLCTNGNCRWITVVRVKE